MFFFFDNISNSNDVPSVQQMLLPHIEALKNLDGRACIKEMNAKTIEIMGLPESITTIPHSNSDKRTKVEYNLAWVRTYLKKRGLIENPDRGIWSLTEKFNELEELDATEIVRTVRQSSLDNQNSTIDSYEAFEKLVWGTLKDISKLQNKEIFSASPQFPCDFILPNGLEGIEGPIYVEVKSNLRDEWVHRSIISITNSLENTAVGSILLISKSELTEKSKQDLYEKLDRLTPMHIHIWDINMLMDRIDPDSDYVEYLVNPQQILLKNAIEQSDEVFVQDQEKVVEKFRQEFLSGNITLFLGAGVSKAAGVPLWDDLINKLLVELIKTTIKSDGISESDVESLNKLAYKNKDDSPLIQMRYIKSAFELNEYYEIIHQALYSKNINYNAKLLDAIVKIATPSLSHKEIRNIVTYNFDNLIEKSFKAAAQPYKSIYREKDVAGAECHNIYHVHGYLPDDLEKIDLKEVELIFSEEDYHKVYRDAYSWSNITQLNFFRESTCVFIGCSLTDPNLRRLLDVAVRTEEEKKPRHYAFMARKTFGDSLKDYNISQKALNAYKNMDNSLKERFLRRLGLNIIWVDNYDEIPKILMKLIAR